MKLEETRFQARSKNKSVCCDVQWYSEARKPGCYESVANFFGSDGIYQVGFNPFCAAVDEVDEISEDGIVVGR